MRIPKQVLAVLAVAGLVFAQRGGNDWMTSGYDAQRSHWVRGDPKIHSSTLADAGSPEGFQFLWKHKFPAATTEPALLDFYIGYRGFRTMGFFGSVNNTVTALDTDMPRVEWENKYGAPSNAANANCPGGMMANVTRPTALAYNLNPGGRGGGRGTPAKSGVGAPGQGAVTIKPPAPRPAAPPPPPKPTPGQEAAAAIQNPFVPRVQYITSITSDGKFHMNWVSNGNEPNEAVPFLPAGARAQGLLVVDGIAYVATTHGCGGAPNGVWALDVAARKVLNWKASGDVAGSAGPAIAPDGTIFVTTTGGHLVALDSKTLAEKDRYTNTALGFRSSPVIFSYKGKDHVAAVNDEGQLQVFAASSLKQPLAFTRATGTYDTGALASWQDPAGVRWILMPTAQGITAWKYSDEGGTPKIERAWASKPMRKAITPIIVNGVVFAVDAGDPGLNATFYALDAFTGQQLFSSGSTISGHVSTGRLAAGGSRVYISTDDGTQYVFGFPLEI
jgi:outer membrane protein assembly factor BamB